MVSWRTTLAFLIAFGAIMLAGCGERLQITGLQNTPPTVSLDPPAAAAPGDAAFTHDLRWTGSDRDGRIDHYLVAVNPRSIDQVDASWSTTPDRVRAVPVRRAPSMTARHAPDDAGDEPTIIVVRAVDDRGALSDPVARAYFEENVAPSVRITVPLPSALTTILVPPTLRIQWEGVDLDGVFTQKPVKYKYRLFGDSDPFFQLGVTDPDSLRRFFAPSFADWDSVSGDTTATTYTNLIPGRRYLFVITAFDEAGDYDPVFSLNKNLLRFQVVPAGVGGPRLTMFNEFFNYTYPSGGFSTDPSRIVQLQVPANGPVTIRWFAEPQAGLTITGYRWGLDLADLEDGVTPGADSMEPEHRRRHRHPPRWSPWSLSTQSAQVGPFSGAGADSEHTLYIEAADNVGNISLGIIRFRPVRVRYDSDLLIVIDTQLRQDVLLPDGTYDRPKGPWPTAAELDTFLFAAGGAPWREYPAGTTTVPGLFAGYNFDTLQTRNWRRHADLTVPYLTLARYRNVVWIVNGRFFDYSTGFPSETALQYMSVPGRVNTLAQYVERGGRLWLLGGGAGTATMMPWNRWQNDQPTFTFSSTLGELGPGRFMYDLVHWRSEFRIASVPTRLRRVPGPVRGHSGWFRSMLPESLLRRSPATDPVPPLRTASDFYGPNFMVEFLQRKNIIEESRGARGDHGWDRCAPPPLDTLYAAMGGGSTGLPTPEQNPYNVVMTHYHGNENGSVVFSGFDLWGTSRRDAGRVVDAVLQGLWHQRKSLPAPVAAGEPEMRSAAR